ncbi:hypothetical protein, conserved [Trypanosoma brucei gambiense DAL972]|uniref:T. brucei spp.-specific protein n=2 Tax=Trypanosoma brucei TaxID=5691 RepID=C9ZZK9_TRYB9|nr:hypothetical protein, conserved [Trypanosoma brucei gambiense DAL972]RHW66974.1 hypothetical protein DPX39_000068200 [Trypanosoma brucei equiperdum]CBH14858.1 hypothetical protein, conserved [Trypanosoma brucei gambiense DAL972]|eukprot:XP_011777124.1 hypothetical protein, conserved [Trypanosoma brucei gambiense DAL972]
MRPLRAWFAMCLVAILLFTVVDVSALYVRGKATRAIFIAVIASSVWICYVLLLFIFLYRPLRRCTALYRTGCCCRNGSSAANNGVRLWFKEQHSLDVCVEELRNGMVDIEGLKRT